MSFNRNRHRLLTAPACVAAAVIALTLADGLAAADPPSSSVVTLADNERGPKRPRDGGAGDPDDREPKDPDDREPRKERDAGSPKDPDEGEAPPENPECVHVRTEARYVAYGYEHIVEIDNTCDQPMACSVVTDVNPTPSNVTVAAGQKRSVTTFRGSPAREFKATVQCKKEEDSDDTE